MFLNRKGCGGAVSALALMASSATAADFYVAPSGGDANPGSLERPWKSLAAVSGRVFAPGDTVRLARGSRYSGCLEIKASGTPEKPIVLTSYGEGATPRLNNPRFADHSGRTIEITGRTRDVTVDYNVSDDVDKFVGVVGVKNLRIANNTIIRTRNSDVALRTFWTFNNQNDDEISIEGNIFYRGRGQVVYRSAKHPQGFLNTSRRNNLYYSPDGDIAAMIGEPLAADEVAGDPQFVNAATGDYTLKPGSPDAKFKQGAYSLVTPIWKDRITP